MKYIPKPGSPGGAGKVIYEGKTTNKVEAFSPLDFLARLVTHIPNKYEQTVRYYGYYSNKSRGVRAKAECAAATEEAAAGTATKQSDDNTKNICSTVEYDPEATAQISTQLKDTTVIIPISLSRKRFKKNWTRLIRKIYNVDPLKCPKCGGRMKIISFIEEEAVIKKILSHENSKHRLSCEEYQPPFEDEFSQEVFYED